MAGGTAKLFVAIDVIFGNKKLTPQEMSAEISMLNSRVDEVTAKQQTTRDKINADKRLVDIDLKSELDRTASRQTQITNDITRIKQEIIALELKKDKQKWEVFALENLYAALERSETLLNDEIEKSKTKVSGLKMMADALDKDIANAEKRRQNWWYVFNGLLHLADRLMDKTNSDFSHFFGIAISVITNTVTSLHAVATGLAASGPVGVIQAGIIVASNITATVSVIQAEAQRQQLEKNKNNIGDEMFR